MRKIVDGVEVEMSPDEVAAIEADWGAASAPPVPAVVTAAQARVALHRAGLLSAVEDAVDVAGGEIAIWFEYSTEWRRDSQHIAALAGGLGLDAPQIDELFRSAARVE